MTPIRTASIHQPDVLRVLQSKKETKAFYNKIAGFYDLLSERTEQPIRQVGLKMLNIRPGEKVLEIGFGTGHCLAHLARAVGSQGRAFGIDLSEHMLRLAKELLVKNRLADRAELRCGDAIRLPYKAGRIDAVFMSFTLELFDTPEIPVVLAECKRVLRPGGRIVVVGMSKANPQGLLTEVFEWTHRHFPNFLDCRPIHVRQAMEDAGFRVTNWRSKKMWIPVEIVLGLNDSHS